MTESNIAIALEMYGKQIPQAYIGTFRSYLQDASDSCMNELAATPIKRKGVTLLLSLFLGGIGVDRFYLGDKGLGIAKLIVGIVSFFLLLVPILGIIVSIGRSIWIIVDWFLTYKKAKEINYPKLYGILLRYKNKKPKAAAASQFQSPSTMAISAFPLTMREGTRFGYNPLSDQEVKFILDEFSKDMHMDGTIQVAENAITLTVPIITFEKEAELVLSVSSKEKIISGEYILGEIDDGKEPQKAIYNFNKKYQIMEAATSLCAMVNAQNNFLMISIKESFFNANDLQSKIMDIIGKFVAVTDEDMQELCFATIVSGGEIND